MRRDELDWGAIERDYRAGMLNMTEIARQHGLTDSGVRKHAKAKGWTRDLSGAVRNRVRESLVREGIRANGSELAGLVPSDAAIIDEAAAIGVAVVRSHRLDIKALREAAAGLLVELSGKGPAGPPLPPELQIPPLRVTDRSRVISDLSQCLARLIPLEREAFGLQETPAGAQVQISWPIPRTSLDD